MADIKTVVLTGASRGIGHATVKRFMQAGWRIVTVSREAPPPECGRNPQWSHHVTADLSLPADRERFIASVLAYLDGAPIQALVNNAGVSPKTPYKERLGILHGPLEGWHQVFELNFYAPIALARGFAEPLARARGAIVNVTSIAGHAIHPFAGSAYSTSKAALSALTREMASELAALGIRVNAVAPGEIRTEMISAEYEPLITRIPMHRMGTTDEVAGVIFQLCEPDFSYVTGSEIFITGGQHLA
ncbi:MAG: SDR family oxidoreductase [Alphaproteobacteria bacterium]|nr:SDR family oxidoreductase [Alphaproteobacteria bacterium]